MMSKIISAKNPVYASADGTLIDLIVTFDGIGEVPFTASGSDMEAHGRSLFVRASAGEFGSIGIFVAPPEPSPATILAQTTQKYEVAAQTMLDELAQSWGYDSLLSAASYFVSSVPRFKDEATALVSWRDAVWVTSNTIMQAVVANTQPLPATVAAFLALLPPIPTRPVA
jgi:hypothetical protein